MAKPIVETKVTAASITAALVGLALWALNTYAFPSGTPVEVEAVITVAVTYLSTFAAGYLAKHTPRPDLTDVDTSTNSQP